MKAVRDTISYGASTAIRLDGCHGVTNVYREVEDITYEEILIINRVILGGIRV